MKRTLAFNYILGRLREASTWRGITLVITSCGIVINPELREAIVTLGLAIVGVIGVVTSDKKSDTVVRFIDTGSS